MKAKNILIAVCLLVGAILFAQSSKEYKIIPKKVSWGFKEGDNTRKVEAVIVHSTFNASGGDTFSIQGVLDQFKKYGVSAHYLIGRDGSIYQLVNEEDVSYHAGVSKLPNGKTNVNTVSIGIEVMITYKSKPTEDQYKALSQLVKDIKKRHTIEYVLRHSDIAPERKTDPWNFDWDYFLKMVN